MDYEDFSSCDPTGVGTSSQPGGGAPDWVIGRLMRQSGNTQAHALTARSALSERLPSLFLEMKPWMEKLNGQRLADVHCHFPWTVTQAISQSENLPDDLSDSLETLVANSANLKRWTFHVSAHYAYPQRESEEDSWERLSQLLRRMSDQTKRIQVVKKWEAALEAFIAEGEDSEISPQQGKATSELWSRIKSASGSDALAPSCDVNEHGKVVLLWNLEGTTAFVRIAEDGRMTWFFDSPKTGQSEGRLWEAAPLEDCGRFVDLLKEFFEARL